VPNRLLYTICSTGKVVQVVI